MIKSILHSLNDKRKKITHRCYDTVVTSAFSALVKVSPVYKYLAKGTVKFIANQIENYVGDSYSNNTIYKLAKEQLNARAQAPNVVINRRSDNPFIYEAALISKDVYTIFHAKLVGGWHVSNLHIDGVQYQDKTGLVSALYERTKANGETEYIYALAGTNPLSYQDIKTDILQVVGKKEQYESALRNARIVSDFLINHELTFVGHSLGGGEAAYCANNIPNRKAITFNPAGLKDGVKGQSNVCAYILMADPLNLLQDLGFGFIPQADGIKHYVDFDSKYFSHDINAVVEAMKHYFWCSQQEEKG